MRAAGATPGIAATTSSPAPSIRPSSSNSALSSGSSSRLISSRPAGKFRRCLAGRSAGVSRAGTKPPDGPDGMNASSGSPSRIPPAIAISSPMVRPTGTSKTPGFATSPQSEKNRIPRPRGHRSGLSSGFRRARYHGVSVMPLSRYQAPPLSAIDGTQAKVSTLFSRVGLLYRPLASITGGRLRGSARCSSIASISADCSPQT